MVLKICLSGIEQLLSPLPKKFWFIYINIYYSFVEKLIRVLKFELKCDRQHRLGQCGSCTDERGIVKLADNFVLPYTFSNTQSAQNIIKMTSNTDFSKCTHLIGYNSTIYTLCR